MLGVVWPNVQVNTTSRFTSLTFKRYLRIQQITEIDTEEKYHLLMAAFLLPLTDYEYSIQKNKREPVIKFIIRESLKLPKSDADTIYLLCGSTTGIQQFIHQVQTVPRKAAGNLFSILISECAGLLIRNIGPLWKQAIILSLIANMPLSEDDVVITQTKPCLILFIVNYLSFSSFSKGNRSCSAVRGTHFNFGKPRT